MAESIYDELGPGGDHADIRAALVGEWDNLLGRADVLVLDTETTGLCCPEVVDIAVIDTRGYRRLNRLVQPAREKIESGATRVHGITMDHLKEEGAPQFSSLMQRMQQLVNEASAVCIYNAGFDLDAISVSLQNNDISDDLANMICSKSRCIMRDYAFLGGDWHDYWDGWAWCKLVEAARRENIPQAGAHRALYDCKMVLGIMRAVVSRGGAA